MEGDYPIGPRNAGTGSEEQLALDVTALKTEIQRDGHATRRFVSYADCADYLLRVGTTIRRASIDVDPARMALLHTSSAMSPHTDHPAVDLIAWYCEEQCDGGGASLLVDFKAIKDSLGPDVLEALARINVVVPTRPRATPLKSIPMLSAAGLYYADWLVDEASKAQYAEVLEAFQEKIATARATSLRLRKGDMLIVDNKRVLHGREAITETTTRRLLYRHWICLHA
ncbi:MAG: TauD/TfdA family dioxygenase [Pseudomonadota bacterium]